MWFREHDGSISETRVSGRWCQINQCTDPHRNAFFEEEAWPWFFYDAWYTEMNGKMRFVFIICKADCDNDIMERRNKNPLMESRENISYI
jgi:hypothetical protein